MTLTWAGCIVRQKSCEHGIFQFLIQHPSFISLYVSHYHAFTGELMSLLNGLGPCLLLRCLTLDHIESKCD